VINPTLYPVIISAFTTSIEQITVRDFGSGSSSLAFDLFIKHTDNVPALQLVQDADLQQARQQLQYYYGYEQVPDLVATANLRFQKFHINQTFSSRILTLPQDCPAPIHNTDQLAVSRNFLMHLSIPDLDQHLQHVRRLVGSHGHYIFSILNPDYEQTKHNQELRDGELYNFLHGQHGELGTFVHYYKTIETYEKIFQQYFTIAAKQSCTPISDAFRDSHERYYNSSIPLAYVYTLHAI
jgi:SAM-dependent methyltransferase